MSIGSSLQGIYNGTVTVVGNAMMATINGIQQGENMQQVLMGYYLSTGIGMGIGIVAGRVGSFLDEAIYGGEVGIQTGVSARLSAFLRNYWEYSGGVSPDSAGRLAKAEGFNFKIGSVTRGSRFDNGFNGVVISKADLVGGDVNRLMLAEEIQHGLDRVSAEASRAIVRGLSNDEFHAEVFQRILDNHAAGKFQFLTGQDLDALSQIIQGL